ALALSGNDLGVVAGGDEIGLELLAVGPELAELQPVVADDARVGRAAGEVFVREVVDDAFEVRLEVERVERDVEPVGDAPGVAGIERAAAAFLVRGGVIVVAMHARAHEQADDLVALLLEQVGGNGAIDSAAHGQYHACRHGGSSFSAGLVPQGVPPNAPWNMPFFGVYQVCGVCLVWRS